MGFLIRKVASISIHINIIRTFISANGANSSIARSMMFAHVLPDNIDNNNTLYSFHCIFTMYYFIFKFIILS